MQQVALEDVLAYRNASVITRYCQQFPDVTAESAQQIFQDLLGWLWLSEHRHQRQLVSNMIKPLAVLDDMWHVFILHTRDYADFCQKYFQRYLHHEVENETDASQSNMESSVLSAYLEECYEYLGEAWLLRNFSTVLSA